MAEAGFKVAEFHTECGRLSKPYELVIISDTNTLTIRQ